MWSENNFQQLSFDDILLNMPEYLKNFLKDSWAHIFKKVISPVIDENSFLLFAVINHQVLIPCYCNYRELNLKRNL